MFGIVVSSKDWVEGVVAVAVVGTGFTYHLGWKDGWKEGFRAGSRVGPAAEDDGKQPFVRSPVGLLYALGWHHGWDYGFRSGTRMREEEPRR
jgi:hypothetical protein